MARPQALWQVWFGPELRYVFHSGIGNTWQYELAMLSQLALPKPMKPLEGRMQEPMTLELY